MPYSILIIVQYMIDKKSPYNTARGEEWTNLGAGPTPFSSKNI